MSAKPTFEIPAPAYAPRETLLIIDAPEALVLVAQLEKPPEVVVSLFPQLDAALLDRVRPDCIALPLLDPRLDVAQALQRLAELGYRGRICVLTAPLPDHAMVEAELRALAPGVTVHLIECPAPG